MGLANASATGDRSRESLRGAEEEEERAASDSVAIISMSQARESSFFTRRCLSRFLPSVSVWNRPAFFFFWLSAGPGPRMQRRESLWIIGWGSRLPLLLIMADPCHRMAKKPAGQDRDRPAPPSWDFESRIFLALLYSSCLERHSCLSGLLSVQPRATIRTIMMRAMMCEASIDAPRRLSTSRWCCSLQLNEGVYTVLEGDVTAKESRGGHSPCRLSSG